MTRWFMAYDGYFCLTPERLIEYVWKTEYETVEGLDGKVHEAPMKLKPVSLDYALDQPGVAALLKVLDANLAKGVWVEMTEAPDLSNWSHVKPIFYD